MLELSELTVVIIRVCSSSVVFSPTIQYLLDEVTVLVFLSSMIWRILHNLHCQYFLYKQLSQNVSAHFVTFVGIGMYGI